MRSTAVPVLCLLASLAACVTGEQADPVVRVDSAGVEIVTSPARDRTLRWTFEEAFRLGGDDEGPGSFTSANYDEVGADGAGDIYVLDRQAFRVVVFGPDGTHVRSMGAEGEGPGELRFPVSFAVREDGRAAVFDIGRGAMISWGPDGSALPPHPFPYYTEPGTIRHFALTPVGYAVARGGAPPDADTREIELRAWPIAVSPEAPAPDTAVLTRLRFPMPEMADFGCMRIAFQPLFAPLVQWDAEGDRIAAVHGVEYAVDLYDLDGTWVRSIRRDLPVRQATEADAVAEAEPGLRMRSGAGSCEASAEEVVEARGFAPALPSIRNVLLAPSGELWVQRFVPGGRGGDTPAPVDVFGADGAYLGTLPDGTRFPLLILPDGRVALEETDALDVERLVVMRVHRGGEAAAGGEG